MIGNIRSDPMKVNAFFELRINKSEIKLLFILWKLWMVNFSPKGINFHGIIYLLST